MMHNSSNSGRSYVELQKLCHEDHKLLRRRLGAILKEPSDIDDVIQDAYVRIMEIKTTGKVIENPPAFMHRVCTNLALDRIRHLQRRDRIFISESCQEITGQFESHSSRAPTPEEECLRQDFQAEIMSVLQELPEKCRNAFLMKQIWGFNYQEIAADIDLSVSMIEKHVKRASLRLQESFAATPC